MYARRSFNLLLFASCIAGSAHAQDAPAPARKPLEARAEINVRGGTERSILMNEFWVPLTQTDSSVLYGDIRLMGDDQDNREFNAGVGYRHIVRDVPVLGDGVAGVHGWMDRRITERGSRFNQITAGAEWSGDVIDLKLNGYMPLNESKTYAQANPNATPGGFVGNQIVVSTAQTVQEEAMKGLDFELGFNVNNIVDNFTDSTRIYGGVYYFSGDKAENVSGWRTRIASDITEDMQIGARFQRDDVRGSQGFLEATIRFPFGNKKSYKDHGLYARLDESPERDIDIVSAEAIVDQGSSVPILNAVTGLPQNVLHVDNAAAPGGTGTKESPFDTLAAAETASADYDIIYIHQGTGTSAKMNTGITLNKPGQMLIGSGTNLLFDGTRFGTANGQALATNLLISSTAAPTITNIAGHGVTVSANDIYLAGFNVVGATGDGIYVNANNLNAQNTIIRDIATTNNGRMGVYLHGYNNGSLSAMVERVVTGGNAQHGIAVYDDTASTFDVDLGGGALGSGGNNILFGNGLEDLAIDYDGRTLSAMNNWWGYATGPDQDNPSDGIKPQIYYGAPINDGLVGHWTFDNEWMNGTTAYDRSGNGYNTTLYNFASTTLVAGERKQALVFDGVNDYVGGAPSDPFEFRNTTGMSVLVWANPDVGNSTGSYLISKPWNGSGNYNYWITMNGSEVPSTRLTSTGTSALSFPGGVAEGSWSQIGFTTDTNGNILTNYTNGEVQNSTNYNAIDFSAVSSGDANVRLAIGTLYPYGSGWVGNTSYSFGGSIDDVRIYNETLPADKIAELYRMDTSSAVDFSGFLSGAP